MEAIRPKWMRLWWLALLVLCVSPCLMPLTCSIDPDRFMDRVPLGSKLSELDQHVGRFSRWTNVDEWTLEKTQQSYDWTRKTDYGEFYVRTLGSYQDWSAPAAVRDRFTGEVVFEVGSPINLDDLAPVYHVSLLYVDGVLKKKYISHRLPG